MSLFSIHRRTNSARIERRNKAYPLTEMPANTLGGSWAVDQWMIYRQMVLFPFGINVSKLIFHSMSLKPYLEQHPNVSPSGDTPDWITSEACMLFQRHHHDSSASLLRASAPKRPLSSPIPSRRKARHDINLFGNIHETNIFQKKWKKINNYLFATVLSSHHPHSTSSRSIRGCLGGWLTPQKFQTEFIRISFESAFPN